MSADESVTTTNNTWPFVQRAFVWAIGSSGLPVAERLAGWSIPVVLFQKGAEVLEERGGTGSEAQGLVKVLRGERVLGIDGHFGRFSIRIRGQDGDVTRCEAGFVVIHGETSPQDRNVCGASVPEANSLTIDELEALASPGGSEGIPKSVGVWLDPSEGLPDRVATERAFRALLSLRTEGEADCYVLARHIPLWGPDGQSLYDALREKGVRFLRLGAVRPDLEAVEGRVELEVQDQTVSDYPVSLRLDRLLLVGQPAPLAGGAEVARLVGDPLDSEGFLQKDNAHLYPSRSFRKGIYYVGSCKGEQAAEELAEEVGAILPSVLEPMVAGTIEPPEGIRINRGHCVSCLTCYRVCPHHAIDISQGPVPVPVDPACYGCGLCAALCPGKAIELVERPGAQILGELDQKNPDEEETLQTIVFCCSRSAPGSEGAAGSDPSLPAQTSVIEVPCACSVSEEMLLAAFLKGADKVVVVGCHPDNCVSQRGSAVGQKLTERVARYLAAGGMDAGECVRCVVAAPNEAHRLSRILSGLDPDHPGPEGRPVAVSSEGETS